MKEKVNISRTNYHSKLTSIFLKKVHGLSSKYHPTFFFDLVKKKNFEKVGYYGYHTSLSRIGYYKCST